MSFTDLPISNASTPGTFWPPRVMKRLVGVENYLAAANQLGYGDEEITNQALAAISDLEQGDEGRPPVCITARRYVADPSSDSTYGSPGDTVESEAAGGEIRVHKTQPLAYYRSDSQTYLRKQLTHRPVLKVYSYRFILAEGHQVNAFPTDWIQYNQWGKVWLQPVQGSVSFNAAAGAWAMFIGGTANKEVVPNALAIDYDAGLHADWVNDADHSPLLRAVTARAAAYVLQDVRQAFDAGRESSNTVAGPFSQSSNYTRFKPDIDALMAESDRLMNNWANANATGMSFI